MSEEKKKLALKKKLAAIGGLLASAERNINQAQASAQQGQQIQQAIGQRVEEEKKEEQRVQQKKVQKQIVKKKALSLNKPSIYTRDMTILRAMFPNVNELMRRIDDEFFPDHEANLILTEMIQILDEQKKTNQPLRSLNSLEVQITQNKTALEHQRSEHAKSITALKERYESDKERLATEKIMKLNQVGTRLTEKQSMLNDLPEEADLAEALVEDLSNLDIEIDTDIRDIDREFDQKNAVLDADFFKSKTGLEEAYTKTIAPILQQIRDATASAEYTGKQDLAIELFAPYLEKINDLLDPNHQHVYKPVDGKSMSAADLIKKLVSVKGSQSMITELELQEKEHEQKELDFDAVVRRAKGLEEQSRIYQQTEVQVQAGVDVDSAKRRKPARVARRKGEDEEEELDENVEEGDQDEDEDGNQEVEDLFAQPQDEEEDQQIFLNADGQEIDIDGNLIKKKAKGKKGKDKMKEFTVKQLEEGLDALKAALPGVSKPVAPKPTKAKAKEEPEEEEAEEVPLAIDQANEQEEPEEPEEVVQVVDEEPEEPAKLEEKDAIEALKAEQELLQEDDQSMQDVEDQEVDEDEKVDSEDDEPASLESVNQSEIRTRIARFCRSEDSTSEKMMGTAERFLSNSYVIKSIPDSLSNTIQQEILTLRAQSHQLDHYYSMFEKEVASVVVRKVIESLTVSGISYTNFILNMLSNSFSGQIFNPVAGQSQFILTNEQKYVLADYLQTHNEIEFLTQFKNLPASLLVPPVLLPYEFGSLRRDLLDGVDKTTATANFLKEYYPSMEQFIPDLIVHLCQRFDTGISGSEFKKLIPYITVEQTELIRHYMELDKQRALSVVQAIQRARNNSVEAELDESDVAKVVFLSYKRIQEIPLHEALLNGHSISKRIGLVGQSEWSKKINQISNTIELKTDYAISFKNKEFEQVFPYIPSILITKLKEIYQTVKGTRVKYLIKRLLSCSSMTVDHYLFIKLFLKSNEGKKAFYHTISIFYHAIDWASQVEKGLIPLKDLRSQIQTLYGEKHESEAKEMYELVCNLVDTQYAKALTAIYLDASKKTDLLQKLNYFEAQYRQLVPKELSHYFVASEVTFLFDCRHMFQTHYASALLPLYGTIHDMKVIEEVYRSVKDTRPLTMKIIQDSVIEMHKQIQKKGITDDEMNLEYQFSIVYLLIEEELKKYITREKHQLMNALDKNDYDQFRIILTQLVQRITKQVTDEDFDHVYTYFKESVSRVFQHIVKRMVKFVEKEVKDKKTQVKSIVYKKVIDPSDEALYNELASHVPKDFIQFTKESKTARTSLASSILAIIKAYKSKQIKYADMGTLQMPFSKYQTKDRELLTVELVQHMLDLKEQGTSLNTLNIKKYYQENKVGAIKAVEFVYGLMFQCVHAHIQSRNDKMLDARIKMEEREKKAREEEDEDDLFGEKDTSYYPLPGDDITKHYKDIYNADPEHFEILRVHPQYRSVAYYTIFKKRSVGDYLTLYHKYVEELLPASFRDLPTELKIYVPSDETIKNRIKGYLPTYRISPFEDYDRSELVRDKTVQLYPPLVKATEHMVLKGPVSKTYANPATVITFTEPGIPENEDEKEVKEVSVNWYRPTNLFLNRMTETVLRAEKNVYGGLRMDNEVFTIGFIQNPHKDTIVRRTSSGVPIYQESQPYRIYEATPEEIANLINLSEFKTITTVIGNLVVQPIGASSIVDYRYVVKPGVPLWTDKYYTGVAKDMEREEVEKLIQDISIENKDLFELQEQLRSISLTPSEEKKRVTANEEIDTQVEALNQAGKDRDDKAMEEASRKIKYLRVEYPQLDEWNGRVKQMQGIRESIERIQKVPNDLVYRYENFQRDERDTLRKLFEMEARGSMSKKEQQEYNFLVSHLQKVRQQIEAFKIQYEGLIEGKILYEGLLYSKQKAFLAQTSMGEQGITNTDRINELDTLDVQKRRLLIQLETADSEKREKIIEQLQAIDQEIKRLSSYLDTLKKEPSFNPNNVQEYQLSAQPEIIELKKRIATLSSITHPIVTGHELAEQRELKQLKLELELKSFNWLRPTTLFLSEVNRIRDVGSSMVNDNPRDILSYYASKPFIGEEMVVKNDEGEYKINTLIVGGIPYLIGIITDSKVVPMAPRTFIHMIKEHYDELSNKTAKKLSYFIPTSKKGFNFTRPRTPSPPREPRDPSLRTSYPQKLEKYEQELEDYPQKLEKYEQELEQFQSGKFLGTSSLKSQLCAVCSKKIERTPSMMTFNLEDQKLVAICSDECSYKFNPIDGE